MSYDGLLASHIVRIFKEKLIGSKIEKISQPENDQIVLQLRTLGGERVKLLIDISSQGSRVQLTNNNFENPLDAPNFCMLLRKHIQGGRITEISQIDLERIFVFDIDTVNEMGYSVHKELIAEVMGKYSNIILLDKDTKKIIDSIKRISIDMNRYRQILPGLLYVQPPKGTLNNNLGLGPSAKIAGEMGADLSLCEPSVWEDDEGKCKDIHVIDLVQYEGVYKKIDFESVFDALDYFYNSKQETNRVSQRALSLSRQVLGLIDKHVLKKSRLLEEIKKSEEADIYRIKGEVLNANLHLVKTGDKFADLVSFYDGKTLRIELSESLSPAKNAQSYFKKYSKLKSSKKEKIAQLSECEKEISYLEETLAQISLAENYAELDLIRGELYKQGFIRINKADERKFKSKPSPRKFILSSGAVCLVGRNNTENDYITFKLAQKGDIWMHTKDIHGSHLILQLNGNEAGPDDIYEAAGIAAFYSKGKDSDKVPVDYVPVKYVKKPAGARPGMVIFTNNKTVWVHPKSLNEK